MRLGKLLLFLLVPILSSSICYGAEQFTPLQQILDEANKNKDEVGYFYIFKRCGALMGAVAGFESGDNREDAKKLVKINNNASEYFINTALNLNSQKKLQNQSALTNDIKNMSVIYVDNFKKNRLLNANIFNGFVGQDYQICADIYKGRKKWLKKLLSCYSHC